MTPKPHQAGAIADLADLPLRSRQDLWSRSTSLRCADGPIPGLYGYLVLAHDRRRIIHFAVTAHPTAEWTAWQLRKTFPWDTAPRSLLRDRDRIFGESFRGLT